MGTLFRIGIARQSEGRTSLVIGNDTALSLVGLMVQLMWHTERLNKKLERQVDHVEGILAGDCVGCVVVPQICCEFSLFLP